MTRHDLTKQGRGSLLDVEYKPPQYRVRPASEAEEKKGGGTVDACDEMLANSDSHASMELNRLAEHYDGIIALLKEMQDRFERTWPAINNAKFLLSNMEYVESKQASRAARQSLKLNITKMISALSTRLKVMDND